jgi:hypothetical protein
MQLLLAQMQAGMPSDPMCESLSFCIDLLVFIHVYLTPSRQSLATIPLSLSLPSD